MAVAGAGPAGIMAALAAQEKGAHAVVFDAAVPLATILRTGGGRCNLTNAGFEGASLAVQYPRGGRFLLSAFSRFGPRDTMAWFRAKGLPLAEEEDGRVFPRSGRAADVRDLLAAEARAAGVRILARQPVTAIACTPGGFQVTTPRGEEIFDKVVIATGGDWRDAKAAGYGLAISLGHTVTRLAPALTGLAAAETWPARLAGLTLGSARLQAHPEGTRSVEETGGLVFTHTGISGPVAFRISSRYAFHPFSRSSPLRLQLSPLADRTRQEIEEAFANAMIARPRQQVLSALRGFLPRALAEVVLSLAGVPPAALGSGLSREQRRTLVDLVDRLALTIVDRDRGEEMVTAGGVDLGEVDPRSMESRICPGLYLCGELLDIDGFTGGFNLQAAWSTGRVAGLAAAG
jgi:hypothetical protein